VVFDNENARVGLAVSSYYPATYGPWISAYVAPNGGGSTNTLAIVLIIFGTLVVLGVVALVVVVQMRKKNLPEKSNDIAYDKLPDIQVSFNFLTNQQTNSTSIIQVSQLEDKPIDIKDDQRFDINQSW
jgi:hypothetical protein